jgi:hypothetical protein
MKITEKKLQEFDAFLMPFNKPNKKAFLVFMESEIYKKEQVREQITPRSNMKCKSLNNE